MSHAGVAAKFLYVLATVTKDTILINTTINADMTLSFLSIISTNAKIQRGAMSINISKAVLTDAIKLSTLLSET